MTTFLSLLFLLAAVEVLALLLYSFSTISWGICQHVKLFTTGESLCSILSLLS